MFRLFGNLPLLAGLTCLLCSVLSIAKYHDQEATVLILCGLLNLIGALRLERASQFERARRIQ